MKAIIQGEVHTSKADKDNLESQLRDEVDAVFHEGREDHIGEPLTLGYVVFLIGALLAFLFMSSLLRGPGLEERTEIPYHGTIDIPLPDLYSRFPSWMILIAGISGGVFSAIGLYLPYISLPLLGEYLVFTSLILKPLFVVGGPLLFTLVLILWENRWLGARNEEMADSIVSISEEEGYEKVAVLCGEAHKTPITQRLEDEGWEVDPQSSSSILSKIH